MAKAPPYDGLTAEMPVASAARLILRALLDAALLRMPDVLRGDDVRAVHDTRVGIRRLRSAMSTFRDCFPPRRWRRLRREVRRIGRTLGDVRDADVHLAMLRTALGTAAGPERPGIAHAVEALGRRRAGALTAFASEFSRFERDRFERLLQPSDDGYAGSARRFIRKGLRRLQQDAEKALADGGHTRLHALRIRTKRLRYMLEFAAPLLDDRARVPLRRLAELQDRLGALADAATFARTYAEQLAGLPDEDPRRLGLERLRLTAERDSERELAAMRTLWHGSSHASRAEHAERRPPRSTGVLSPPVAT